MKILRIIQRVFVLYVSFYALTFLLYFTLFFNLYFFLSFCNCSFFLLKTHREKCTFIFWWPFYSFQHILLKIILRKITLISKVSFFRLTLVFGSTLLRYKIALLYYIFIFRFETSSFNF